MFKIIVMVTKPASITDAEFRERYLKVQGPLVAGFPGLRRYVQNPVIASSEPGVSGVAELWFDDQEAWAQARASEAFAMAARNLPSFAERTVSLVVDEVQFELPGASQ